MQPRYARWGGKKNPKCSVQNAGWIKGESIFIPIIFKADKNNHDPVCEHRAEAEVSNIGEIPWKWSVSEDQNLVIVADAVLTLISPWTGSGTAGHVRGLYRCWTASQDPVERCFGTSGGPRALLAPGKFTAVLVSSNWRNLYTSFAFSCKVCPASSVHTCLSWIYNMSASFQGLSFSWANTPSILT